MKNILKKGLLWCLILSVICTIHPVPTNAAVKTTKLKAPVVREWKKTKDSRWSILPADGLEYTVTWKRVAGASGYQAKVEVLDAGEWGPWRIIKTKKCSHSEAGSTVARSKIKVGAYKIVNGKKKYGPWSKIKVSRRWG